ncbi:MAG: SPOR domain-containing protein [Brucellaceae bacterium]|nr:SPOR domain-containing protein [Brucellaceae bacterium]
MAAVDALSDVAEESTGEASDDDDGFSQEAEPEPVADELDYDIAADDAADSVTFEVADGDEDDGLDIDLDDLASEDLAAEPVSGFSIEPDLSDDAYDADLTVEAEADAAPRELTVASYDRVTEAEPRDDDEAAFAELLARADSEMTDEDFEAAAAALDAEAVTHASAADDYDDDEAEFEALPDYEPAVEEDLPPEPQASADAEDDAADLAGDDVDIEAELAAFDEAVRAAGALDAGDDETADEEPLPDIDTLEVDETIAATADFDIPELLEDEEPVVAAGDDFEAEFAESLARYREESAARHEATEASAETPASEDDVFETLFERDLTRDIEAATAGMAGLGMSASASAADDTPYAGDDLQFDLMDDDLDEPIGIPPAETVTGRPASGRRGFMVASAVGALAIFGVAFAVGSSFFGGEDGPAETTLIKADSEPVKIKPENPGGTTVPNQDNAVYDRVAGTAEEQPAQEALITTAEEPVELPEQAAPEVPMQKAEDRLTPADTEDGASPTEAELALISPKRVRTLIVKPDGSLVERAEELAAAQAAPGVADTVSSEALAATQESGETEVAALAPEPVALEEPQAEGQLVDVAIPTPRPDIEAETGAEADAAPADAAVETDTAAAEPAAEAEEPVPLTEVAATEEPAVPVRAVQSETIRPTTTDDAGTTRQVSRTVPVPSDRSADQPANVVGRTGSEQAQTAAAQPTPTPASGGYVVQIASLPSVAEAQSSFANLSARYGNLIGGRAMNIQRADIPGKGTFYRVRVAAQDRSDATSLCTRIKAAGGSCFVAR